VSEKEISRKIIFAIKEMKKEILNTVNVIETIVNKMSPSGKVVNCIGKAVE
jgi:hypothetical protein